MKLSQTLQNDCLYHGGFDEDLAGLIMRDVRTEALASGTDEALVDEAVALKLSDPNERTKAIESAKGRYADKFVKPKAVPKKNDRFALMKAAMKAQETVRKDRKQTEQLSDWAAKGFKGRLPR